MTKDAEGQTVKGINFITALYEVDGITLPVVVRSVTKTEEYIGENRKPKRRSTVTKNEHYRAMLQQCVRNQIPFHYVLNDIRFASAELDFVHFDLEPEKRLKCDAWNAFDLNECRCQIG